MTRPTTETPILILGLAGLSMHHGALGAMRSLGRLGVPVFLAHGSRRSALERSRYCCGSIELPLDRESARALETLLQFGTRYGGPLLLAVDDASAMFVNDHGGELAEVFRLPAQPDGLARTLADKREMHRLCLEHDVDTPRVAFPGSEADVIEHAATAVFPVVAKRIDASLPTEHPTPNVLLAHSREELLSAHRALRARGGANVMLQEYIPGTRGADWMFNGYFDADSRSRVSFTGVKIRQAPPATGATTLGVCRANREIARTTERFMQAVGYRGILDVDYRLDRRDGRYKLLDVNPRIGSSFRLFLAADGLDVLRAMYFDLTGQDVTRPTATELAGPDAGRPPAVGAQQDGRRWVVEPQDLRYSVAYLKREGLTVQDWLRSFRGLEEAAWWAREDPGPFLALSTQLLADRAHKIAMRLGRRCA